MKKSKIIIPALAMLVMSTAATVTGTVAWFSMNKTVTADGMKVKAEGQGSIIIKKYDGGDTYKGRPRTTDKTTGVDFGQGTAYPLMPTTHCNTGTINGGTNTTGLQILKNGGDICYETGTAKNGTVTLTYDNISSATDHYIDYELWIAGDNGSFSDQDVKIELSGLNTTLAAMSSINKAVSIDFYAGVGLDRVVPNTAAAASGGNFVGTLNCAGLDSGTNNGVATKTFLTISNTAIPESGDDDNGALYVLMRVYYDGALVQSAGTSGYTELSACGAGAMSNTFTDAAYFYNASGDIIMEKPSTNTSVEGLYVVNTSASTKTFARSVDYNYLADVGIGVVFTASAHQNG